MLSSLMVIRRILWRDHSFEPFGLTLDSRLRCSDTSCIPGACMLYIGCIKGSAHGGGGNRGGVGGAGRFGGVGAGRVGIYGIKSLTMVSLRPFIGETLSWYNENKKASSSIIGASAFPKTFLRRSSSMSESFIIFRITRALGTENVT